MIGKPKYKYDQPVSFRLGDKTYSGIIAIIDRYGTFEDDSDVSYDIYSKEENVLYKHIREDLIIP